MVPVRVGDDDGLQTSDPKVRHTVFANSNEL